MLQRHILLLVVLLGLSACGLAHASMVLTDASSGMPLNAHIELLEDTQGTLSIDNITAPEQQARFQPANGRASVGQSLNPWWVKLTLQRDEQAPERWVLEVGSVTQLDLQLYQANAQGSWQLRQAGERVPFTESRDHPYRRMVFDLPAIGEQPMTLYLRAFDPAGNSFPCASGNSKTSRNWQPARTWRSARSMAGSSRCCCTTCSSLSRYATRLISGTY